MNKLKIDGIVSQQTLENAEKLLSQRDLEVLEQNIEFLISEMTALRQCQLSYAESLLTKEMLKKGYLLAYIDSEVE
jgi:predicted DNA-binding transcriptional regulator